MIERAELPVQRKRTLKGCSSTIRHAHKIVVIENGEMVEAGRHDELLELSGVYYRLHALQMHSFDANS